MQNTLQQITPQTQAELLMRLYGYHRQILQLMKQIDQNNDLGNRDHLTGLYNRDYAREQYDALQNTLCRLRPDSKIGLLYLDIDHFKKVNDTYGHDKGDEVIRHLGQTLLKVTREGDVVFRCGKGEEIAILFEAKSAQEVLEAGKRIRNVVNAHPYTSSDQSIRVTSSFAGVALSPQECSTLDDVLTLADPLLYEAKNRGRDCIVVKPDGEKQEPFVFPDRKQNGPAFNDEQTQPTLTTLSDCETKKMCDLPEHLEQGSVFDQIKACEKEIVRLQTLHAQAEAKAHTDGMTGLLNRRGGETAYHKMTANMSRHDKKSAVGLLFLDIDHFKKINDIHGHSTGDEGLKHVAKILKEFTRSGDIVMRYGGEEFCVLLRAESMRQVLSVGRRLGRTLEQTPLKIGDKSIHMTMSVGAEIFTLEDLKQNNLKDILKKGDEAMYIAKHKGGRNCLAVIRKNGQPVILGKTGHKNAAIRPRRNPRAASLEKYRR
ncbi:MAG: GGDEF domain-containing protein [Alphaproteobacteria bacterium]|jgi:diguanylate cyclase (GGDEF)-like protein|nr:GGDEF domain-containing protein [Alphaproteobacteria bacterium]